MELILHQLSCAVCWLIDGKRKRIRKKGFFRQADAHEISSGGIDHAGRSAGIDLETGQIRMVDRNRLMDQPGAAGPGVIGCRFGKHRNELNIRLCAGPFGWQVGHVEVDAGFGAPVNMDWSIALLGDGVFDHGFDWGKAGAAGQQDDWFFRIFAQEKAAVWAVEAQDVALLHGAEHLISKESAGNVADMQFNQCIVMRGIGQRETTLLAILEQDVNVLAGEELQALSGG